MTHTNDSNTSPRPGAARFQNILLASIGSGGESGEQLECAARLADVDGASITFDDRTTANRTNERMSLPLPAARRAHRIAEQASSGSHDLVIVAPDSTFEAVSTARELVMMCPTPVLAVNVSMMSGDVVAIVDPIDRVEINTASLRHAAAHAARTGGKVHVLAAGPARRAASARRQRAMLSDMVSRLGLDAPFELHVSSLAVAPAAIGLSAMVGAPLVVIGAAAVPGRPAMSRTARGLVASPECSVLVARPADADGALRAPAARVLESAAAR